jgi:hypothetical protein
MIESVEKLDSIQTIYWFGGKPRRGLIIEGGPNCVTDEIATGYDLGESMLAKTVEGLYDTLQNKE